MSLTEELFELISNTLNQKVSCGNIESITNPVDALSQIAEIAAHKVTQCRSNVQVKEVNFRGMSGHCCLFELK